MLEVRGLAVRLAGIRVLDGVAFKVAPGKVCAVRGHNGAGKTTLMRAIMGLVPSETGEVRLDSLPLHCVPAYQRARRGIGYMPEERRLVPTLSAEENIAAPAWAMGLTDVSERLGWILQLIPEIEPLRDLPASSLSGGQQKLIALARALMSGRKLLLLDEPTEGVAPILADRLLDILRHAMSSEVAVLVAESSEAGCADIFDEIYELERGVLNLPNNSEREPRAAPFG